MLLTATATPRVRKDILVQMGLISKDNNGNVHQTASTASFSRLEDRLSKRNYSSVDHLKSNKQCAFFMQSFNRENLQYKVGFGLLFS